MTLFDALKTLLLLIVFIYIAPHAIEGIKKQYTTILEPRTHIGIISIKETLSSSCQHTAELHSFFKNPSIKGIVIKMDSLGGSAGTSQTIFHEIRHLKKEYPKPIITLVENNCIAGSYLIASACDYIIAPESAIIGNIGPNFIKTEQYKTLYNTHGATPEEEKVSLKNIDHDAYQQLTKQIAAARKLSLTTIANWADGKIFTAHQAIGLGLINEIGSLSTVIKVIREKALIENDIEWIEHKKHCYFYETPSISSLAIKVQYDNE